MKRYKHYHYIIIYYHTLLGRAYEISEELQHNPAIGYHTVLTRKDNKHNSSINRITHKRVTQ